MRKRNDRSQKILNSLIEIAAIMATIVVFLFMFVSAIGGVICTDG